MTRANPLGHRYDNPAIPPVPENTKTFTVGPVEIGVEYRHLTDDILGAAYADDAEAAAVIEASKPEAGLDDEGISIHVCDAGTGDEYLRFDCFADDPHYHYILPGSHQIVIAFDEVAGGRFLDWAIERLRSRLPEMLREAGAVDLADRVDPAEIEAALPTITAAVAAAH
jgi:hypothetical protein